MIGNETMARKALDGEFSLWAAGTSRDVYLDREAGVVYKVANMSGDGTNEEEAARYNILREIVEPPLAIPETALYQFDDGDVVAMRFISGNPMAECYCDLRGEPHDSTCLPEKIVMLAQSFITDTSGENIVFDGDLYWIIDFPY